MSFPRYPAYKNSGIKWLGEVPEHWEAMPLFSVANECDEPNKGMIEDNLLSLSYGNIICKNINANDGLLPESFETYQIIRQGDIVLRLTDLQNDQRSLRSALVGEVGIITSAYTAIRPVRVRPSYLAFLLRAYDVQKIFYSMGGGLRQSMKFADLRRLPVLMPSVGEQSAIAAFLDRETGKIDALVAEQEKLIGLLKEKRQAVISHAVTKGLDPSAPMKDSGIPWLGEVSAHWEVKPLKHLSKVGNGATPLRDEPRYWESGTYPWLNSSVVNCESVKSSEAFVTETALDECSLPRIIPPAVLVGITGEGRTRGMATTLLFEATINQHVAYIKPLDERLHVGYLRRFLDMAYGRLRFESGGGGSTKGAITCEQLCRTNIPLPPHDEQAAISRHLDLERERFDTLAAEAQRAIALLKEHRSALISAAVTGKIDVRDCVALREVA